MDRLSNIYDGDQYSDLHDYHLFHIPYHPISSSYGQIQEIDFLHRALLYVLQLVAYGTDVDDVNLCIYHIIQHHQCHAAHHSQRIRGSYFSDPKLLSIDCSVCSIIWSFPEWTGESLQMHRIRIHIGSHHNSCSLFRHSRCSHNGRKRTVSAVIGDVHSISNHLDTEWIACGVYLEIEANSEK